jgi:hypothetical protein
MGGVNDSRKDSLLVQISIKDSGGGVSIMKVPELQEFSTSTLSAPVTEHGGPVLQRDVGSH